MKKCNITDNMKVIFIVAYMSRLSNINTYEEYNWNYQSTTYQEYEEKNYDTQDCGKLCSLSSGGCTCMQKENRNEIFTLMPPSPTACIGCTPQVNMFIVPYPMPIIMQVPYIYTTSRIIENTSSTTSKQDETGKSTETSKSAPESSYTSKFSTTSVDRTDSIDVTKSSEYIGEASRYSTESKKRDKTTIKFAPDVSYDDNKTTKVTSLEDKPKTSTYSKKSSDSDRSNEIITEPNKNDTPDLSTDTATSKESNTSKHTTNTIESKDKTTNIKEISTDLDNNDTANKSDVEESNDNDQLDKGKDTTDPDKYQTPNENTEATETNQTIKSDKSSNVDSNENDTPNIYPTEPVESNQDNIADSTEPDNTSNETSERETKTTASTINYFDENFELAKLAFKHKTDKKCATSKCVKTVKSKPCYSKHMRKRNGFNFPHKLRPTKPMFG